jgi:hypothetical protein
VFKAEDHQHPELGHCVRIELEGSIWRQALAGDRRAQTRMQARLILYLTIDDGKHFTFHDDPRHSRSRMTLPEVAGEPGQYERYIEHADRRQTDRGEHFGQISRFFLRYHGSERTIFDPRHWRHRATPVFLPTSTDLSLSVPSLLHFNGFNNLRTYINYVSAEANE